jgi:hypothetical protein
MIMRVENVVASLDSIPAPAVTLVKDVAIIIRPTIIELFDVRLINTEHTRRTLDMTWACEEDYTHFHLLTAPVFNY